MEKYLNILLAEDDLISRRLIKTLIEKTGHKVSVVDNGKKAFEEFIKNKYDVILMDIQMPQLDGLQATKKIREEEKKTNRIPITIIAVTAHAMSGDREKCINAGMDDYITKPIEEKVLIEKITQLRKKNKELKIFNMERLNKLLENPTDIKEIISDFLNYSPDQLKKVLQAHKKTDYLELKNAIHKLKGSASNFEAQRVMKICEKIETQCEQGNTEELKAHITILKKELEAFQKGLREYQGKFD